MNDPLFQIAVDKWLLRTEYLCRPAPHLSSRIKDLMLIVAMSGNGISKEVVKINEVIRVEP